MIARGGIGYISLLKSFRRSKQYFLQVYVWLQISYFFIGILRCSLRFPTAARRTPRLIPHPLPASGSRYGAQESSITLASFLPSHGAAWQLRLDCLLQAFSGSKPFTVSGHFHIRPCGAWVPMPLCLDLGSPLLIGGLARLYGARYLGLSPVTNSMFSCRCRHPFRSAFAPAVSGHAVVILCCAFTFPALGVASPNYGLFYRTPRGGWPRTSLPLRISALGHGGHIQFRMAALPFESHTLVQRLPMFFAFSESIPETSPRMPERISFSLLPEASAASVLTSASTSRLTLPSWPLRAAICALIWLTVDAVSSEPVTLTCASWDSSSWICALMSWAGCPVSMLSFGFGLLLSNVPRPFFLGSLYGFPVLFFAM